MAAPVIWFGSWFLSLMAGSGYAICCAASSVGFLENKKGAQEAPCTPPEFGWPQPSPAVRLGTTTIRSLVILLRIWPTELPKGCANIAANPGKSREGRTKRLIHSLAGFFNPGEGENAPCSHARCSRPRYSGAREGANPESRDSQMCNCPSESLVSRAPRNDGCEPRPRL